MPAIVFLEDGIRAAEYPSRTPLFSVLRQLYLPVMIPYLVGVETAEDE